MVGSSLERSFSRVPLGARDIAAGADPGTMADERAVTFDEVRRVDASRDDRPSLGGPVRPAGASLPRAVNSSRDDASSAHPDSSRPRPPPPPPRLPRRTASACWTRRSTRRRRSSRRPRATSATRWRGSAIRSPPWWTRWTDRCVSVIGTRPIPRARRRSPSPLRKTSGPNRSDAAPRVSHSDAVPTTDTLNPKPERLRLRTSPTRDAKGGADGAREAARGGQAQPGGGGGGAAAARLGGEVRGRARAAAGTRAPAGGVRVAVARQGGARGAHRAHERRRVM